MRALARHARAWALLVLSLCMSMQPALAQEAPPDAVQPTPRASAPPRASATPRERAGQRLETIRGERARIRLQAPAGFERWLRELPPVQRRQLERRLRRMPEPQRERFFREWSRLSLHERRELAERLTLGGVARRRRELPPRLRTPEMRERLEAMSPEQRREFVGRVRAWREMDPGERRGMRARLEKFGGMTADEQRVLVDERFKRHSPEERARILRELRAASRQMRELRGAREGRAPAGQSKTPTAQPEAAAPSPAPDPPAPN